MKASSLTTKKGKSGLLSSRQRHLLTLACSLALTAAMLVGCTDESMLVSEDPEALAVNPQLHELNLSVTNGAVCETIDFNGFSNGNPITSASLFGGDLALTISALRYVSPTGTNGGATQATAFDTNQDGNLVQDDDLVYTNGFCAACNGLERLLVIPAPNFAAQGDWDSGGEVTFSGFSAGTYWVETFTAVDRDPNERPIRLFVDGVLTGQTAQSGNGHVEVVDPPNTLINSQIVFKLGTPAQDSQTGSGAIDNIKICHEPDTNEGGEGCTLGYWKNHTDAWAATGYSTGATLESVFNVPNVFGLDNVTLLAALGFDGGPGALGGARLLLKQAVAALLNAAHPDVSYEFSEAEVIAMVNSALATQNRSQMLGLKNQLDTFNNAGCPLN